MTCDIDIYVEKIRRKLKISTWRLATATRNSHATGTCIRLCAVIPMKAFDPCTLMQMKRGRRRDRRAVPSCIHDPKRSYWHRYTNTLYYVRMDVTNLPPMAAHFPIDESYLVATWLAAAFWGKSSTLINHTSSTTCYIKFTNLSPYSRFFIACMAFTITQRHRQLPYIMMSSSHDTISNCTCLSHSQGLSNTLMAIHTVFRRH